MEARLGAGHGDGRGVRDGAPPAPRGGVAGAFDWLDVDVVWMILDLV